MHKKSTLYSVIYKLEIRFVHVQTNKNNIKVITRCIHFTRTAFLVIVIVYQLLLHNLNGKPPPILVLVLISVPQ